MSDPKRANARLIDFGNLTTIFVDDLATIEEFGTVTHVVFARYARSGEDVHREATLCLIIPNELRVAMGRRLMTGTANTHTAAEAENAQLH
jgi:hypothetical protein